MKINTENANHSGLALVVDDASIMLLTCRRALEATGYKVLGADSGEQALKILEANPVNVTLTDIRMPGISGVDLLKEIKARWPAIEVVMMTAYADSEIAAESLKLGASELLIKPFENINVVVEAVHKSMVRVGLRRGEEPEEGPAFEEIVRKSGLVNDEQLSHASIKAGEEGVSLKHALLSMNIISPQDLDWTLADYLDLPYVRISQKMMDLELVLGFPPDLAREFTCLPVFKSGQEMHLVIANPFNDQAAQRIENELQVTPVFSKGFGPEIKKLIDRIYGPAQEQGVDDLINRLKDDNTPDRSILIQELMARVQLEEVMQLNITPSGPNLFDFSISGRLRADSGK